MESFLLGVEGGGTQTRVLLTDARGFFLAREYGGTASTLYVDPAQYRVELERLLRTVQTVADKAGNDVRAAGCAGPMDHTILRDVVTEIFGDIPIQTYSESDIALACNGLTWGVSLVAGTGASCRAVNEKGEAHSCGGYGPQFGDEGSGYWIGREAVSAAMRARDGRNSPTLLSDLICRKLEIGDIWDILRRAERSGHVAGPVIASLTPLVYDAARSGDAAALDICKRAGAHLADLAATTATKLEFAAQEIPLVLSGGVFSGNDLIMTSFAETLSSQPLVRFCVRPPLTDVTGGIITCLLREPH